MDPVFPDTSLGLVMKFSDLGQHLKGEGDIGRAKFPLSVFILSLRPLSIAKMPFGCSHDNNNKTFIIVDNNIFYFVHEEKHCRCD